MNIVQSKKSLAGALAFALLACSSSAPVYAWGRSEDGIIKSTWTYVTQIYKVATDFVAPWIKPYMPKPEWTQRQKKMVTFAALTVACTLAIGAFFNKKQVTKSKQPAQAPSQCPDPTQAASAAEKKTSRRRS